MRINKIITNAFIFYQILSTNSVRKRMEISLEKIESGCIWIQIISLSCNLDRTQMLWLLHLGNFLLLSRVFTWCHGDHIGVPKQWNGRHVGVPNQSSGSWTLFLCKCFYFFCSNKFAQMLAIWVKMLSY